MRRVFLSYRRDDSQTVTSFIYQHLEDPAAFGPGSVFMDIDDIPDGVDFRDVIDEVVRKCEFFLHVIGPRWVTPRLMDSNDWVRLEIEAALRRQIPVTPVLVDGATMPGEDQLPPSLHPLRFKNARTIRHGKHFGTDVLDMVKGLHRGQKWLADRAATLFPPAGERRDVSPPVVPSSATPLQPEGLSPPAQASGLGLGGEMASSLKGSLAGNGETLSGSKPQSSESPGRSPGLEETALRAEDKPPAEARISPSPPMPPVRKASNRLNVSVAEMLPDTHIVEAPIAKVASRVGKRVDESEQTPVMPDRTRKHDRDRPEGRTSRSEDVPWRNGDGAWNWGQWWRGVGLCLSLPAFLAIVFLLDVPAYLRRTYSESTVGIIAVVGAILYGVAVLMLVGFFALLKAAFNELAQDENSKTE